MIPALLVLWLAVVYLPFAMRTWRQFLVLCGAFLLTGIGVRLGVAWFSAAEVPSALVMIGNFWLDLVVWVLPVPIVARAVVLAAKSLGLRGARLVALNLAGVLALPGTWLGLAAYDRWERRPAPVECTARPVALALSGIEGAVPWTGAITLYVGPELPEDARYMFSPAGQRRICSETANGTKRLEIAALSVKLQRPPSQRCTAADILPWERALCDASDDSPLRALPHDVVFFDPNGIRLGYFGIPKAVTDENYPTSVEERLVWLENTEAGTDRAVCRKEPFSNGQFRCSVRRKLADGIEMSWETSAQPGDLPDLMDQANAFTRTVCSSLFDLPGY